MNWAAMVWFVLTVLFLLLEAGTVTMVSTWFAAGSLAAMTVSLLGGGIWLQAVAFLVISAVLLLLLRPIAKKYFTPRLTKTNVDGIVGTTGIVTQPIRNDLSQGQVKIGAMEWSARSADNTPISVGTQVRVEKIQGVKVLVTPVKETVSI